jgi:hypothetical protein
MIQKQIAKTKMDRAQQFLAELLDETLEWSCTDTQHDLAPELKIILGEYCPDWIARTEDEN